MTVAETLQGDGRWSVQLRDDAPGSIVERLLDRYSLLKVTAAQVPVDVLSSVTPLYTGIRLGSEQWGEVHGAGPSWLLGSPLSDGQQTNDPGWRGPFTDLSKTSTTGTLAGWVTSILPKNGITVGGVGSGNGNPNLAGALRGCARTVLDAVAKWFGCETQVSSALKFYIGTRSELFGDTDEYKALLVRQDSAGHDAAVAAWTMTDAQLSLSDEDRVNRVFAAGTSTHNTGTPSDGLNDPSGSQIDISYFEGIYTDSGGTGPDADDQATAAMNAAYSAKSSEVRSFTVSISEYEPISQFDDGTASKRHWFPGGNVAVYDPAHNVFDLANPVSFRGRTVFPAIIRVVGWEWPIRTGYGVYLDNTHNAGDVTDLTPYVAWEDQDITLTVGQLPPSLTGARRLVAP